MQHITKKSRRRWYIVGVVVLLICLLIVFRMELLFAFQRYRLNSLGCSSKERVFNGMPLTQWQPCQKLWAHRVDSYARFLYLKDYFSGMETDVVFDSTIQNFRVYHPPALPTGLCVDDYFKVPGPHKGLWLDVKGIDPGEYMHAVNFLLKCDRLYGIKKYVIIECSKMEFINLLARSGFTTSYMVPPKYLQHDTPGQVTDSVRQQLLQEVTFVSQEDIFLPYLKKRFPGKKIITWAISFKNYFNLSHFRSLINDTDISVVLINCKSKAYY